MGGLFLLRDMADTFTWKGTICMLQCFQPHSCRSYTDNFFHQSADKLYNVLKRSRPEDTSEETRALLKTITDMCHQCQLMARKPITFMVGSASDPDITFNRETSLDIFHLRDRPVLRIVDIDKHFDATSFLCSISTDDVWDALLRNWDNINAGFAESILTDLLNVV
jgi:hypothetical protein